MEMSTFHIEIPENSFQSVSDIVRYLKVNIWSIVISEFGWKCIEVTLLETFRTFICTNVLIQWQYI